MNFREERELTAIGIIPARIASTRLPAKPLHKINGKMLIERVYERAVQSTWLKKIYIATDSREIQDAAKSFGAEAILSPADLPTGTDRIRYVADAINDESDIVFNIQGDEPLINAEDLDNLFIKLANSLCHVGTLIKKVDLNEELHTDSIVKVVMKTDNEALYFSRSPIPFVRDHEKSVWHEKQDFWKHIGIYAYRREILNKFSDLPQTDLEISESLEQLRLLQNGYKFLCVETKNNYMAIDTPQDVLNVEEYLTRNNIA